MILESIVTCPDCGHKATEAMPTDACQFFYNCVACGVRLKPKAGDCCVFCSYGSMPCPPVQAERSGESVTASCCPAPTDIAASAARVLAAESDGKVRG